MTPDTKKADGLIRFIIADCFLLVADVLAVGFRGQAGTAAFYIVRIANFLVFVMAYLVIISGVSYFGAFIEERVKVSIRSWKFIEYGTGCVVSLDLTYRIISCRILFI